MKKVIIFLGLFQLNTLFGVVFTVPIIILSIPRLSYFYTYDISKFFNIIIIDLLLLIVFFFFCRKYFIPAVRFETALELNETGIISRIREINITWDRIQNVRYYTGRYSSFIAIDLEDKEAFEKEVKNPFWKFFTWNNNMFYSTPLVLPTVSIKGKDKEIFESVKNYLDDFKSKNEKK